jgi:hypothetical protein
VEDPHAATAVRWVQARLARTRAATGCGVCVGVAGKRVWLLSRRSACSLRRHMRTSASEKIGLRCVCAGTRPGCSACGGGEEGSRG